MNNLNETFVSYTFPRGHLSMSSKKVSKLRTILLIIIISSFVFSAIGLADAAKTERKKTKHIQRKKVKLVNNNDLCTTSHCKKAANNLLKSIDETVDPCENFYEFVCGNWIRNHEIPSDDYRQSVITNVENTMHSAIIDLLSSVSLNETVELNSIINARRLYDSCINEQAIEDEGIDEILSLINTEFGGWPLWQGSTWNESTFNFSELWFKLSQYNTFVFYDVTTKMDIKNTSIYSIRVTPGTLGLLFPALYDDISWYSDPYRQYIRSMALAAATDITKLDADVDSMFELEKELSRSYQRFDGNPTGKFKHTTLHNLSQIINITFDLTTNLRRLYQLGNVTLKDDDIIVVIGVEAFNNISSVIARQSPRTLQNYMIWRFLMSIVPHMPKHFRNIYHKYRMATIDVNDEKSRAIICADFVNKYMGYAVSRLYINKHVDKLTLNKSLILVDNIRETFIEMINQSMWMENTSKMMSIKKAKAMLEKVGYPDHLIGNNVTRLEKFYAEYKFNSSHIQNVLTLYQALFKEYRRLLRRSINHQDSSSFPPTTIGAFYLPLINHIVVPGAMLQSPIFHKNAPNYLNYGALGSIVGHEISHGFDQFRWRSDFFNTSAWKSNGTMYTIEKRSKCITEQYNNYRESQLNLQVRGARTLEENIADTDGLKKAFFAYKKWAKQNKKVDKKLPGLTKYSAEQLFFISFGHLYCAKMSNVSVIFQTFFSKHSPGQFRVKGATSNFHEFDRVFQCKPGQNNSRIDKCNVW